MSFESVSVTDLIMLALRNFEFDGFFTGTGFSVWLVRNKVSCSMGIFCWSPQSRCG